MKKEVYQKRPPFLDSRVEKWTLPPVELAIYRLERGGGGMVGRPCEAVVVCYIRQIKKGV